MIKLKLSTGGHVLFHRHEIVNIISDFEIVMKSPEEFRLVTKNSWFFGSTVEHQTIKLAQYEQVPKGSCVYTYSSMSSAHNNFRVVESPEEIQKLLK